jgi:hypothetical protein
MLRDALARLRRWPFRNYFRPLPLLGGLADCDARDHWNSLGETFVVLLISTTPIWLGTLVVYATGNSTGPDAFWAAFYGTVSNGRLFMYSTTILAPMFWIALVDLPGASAFPTKVSHMVLIGIIDAIASVFFGLTVAGKPLNERFTFHLSTVMFWAAVILLYLGTVYHTSRIPDVPGEYKKQESDFTEAYSEHRQ